MTYRRRAVAMTLAVSVAGCAATLEHTAAGPRFRVTILGRPADPRVAPAREALAQWNREFLRLGRRVPFDGTVRDKSVPDDVLRAASGEAMLGVGPATTRLRTNLSGVPGDNSIALSDTDLISFSMHWRSGSHNRDSTTLMCGRSASCRPAAFASDSAHFSP